MPDWATPEVPSHIDAPLSTIEAAAPAQVRLLPDDPEPGTFEYSLGFDPSVNQFREGEYRTARWLVEVHGLELVRAHRESLVDWFDASGRSYDAMGGFSGEYLQTRKQWAAFIHKLDTHDRKADLVPIDVSQFDADQIARIRELLRDRDETKFFLVGE
ncbi:hypothetical protein GXB85_12850 [Cellulomonas sp. APG4]|uniref:hypothetical protein n=1 Tax=Cellulomonas sp. APG4 TaxID=1538656 RepID=UPI001379A6A8|nr:hypothetical protein [Cellulomonas sp. APG4]NCT91834.1 hypothetical protein [Cellulomonas sp. APG4]